MPQKQYSEKLVPFAGRELDLECSAHGFGPFIWENYGRRYRCRACNTDAIYARKQRIKAELVDIAGGSCVRCGYNQSLLALQFHHRDPAAKLFDLSSMTSKSRADCLAEAAKCDLLCANCHAEIEGELRMGRVGLEPTI